MSLNLSLRAVDFCDVIGNKKYLSSTNNKNAPQDQSFTIKYEVEARRYT